MDVKKCPELNVVKDLKINDIFTSQDVLFSVGPLFQIRKSKKKIKCAGVTSCNKR